MSWIKDITIFLESSNKQRVITGLDKVGYIDFCLHSRCSGNPMVSERKSMKWLQIWSEGTNIYKIWSQDCFRCNDYLDTSESKIRNRGTLLLFEWSINAKIQKYLFSSQKIDKQTLQNAQGIPTPNSSDLPGVRIILYYFRQNTRTRFKIYSNIQLR